jgi:hypothetical protein
VRASARVVAQDFFLLSPLYNESFAT